MSGIDVRTLHFFYKVIIHVLGCHHIVKTISIIGVISTKREQFCIECGRAGDSIGG